MCTHLDKTGSIYYFRRPVPKDLIGQFTTLTGAPRAEWKFSLGTKDREEAKRLLRPHVTNTDDLIDDARASLAAIALPENPPPSDREREEHAAFAALEAEGKARREARSELRTLWYKRRQTSTAMLKPEEAAAVDLLRDKDAHIAELEQALTIMRAANTVAGIPDVPQANRLGQPALTLSSLYERFAATGTANPKTVVKWRPCVAALVRFLGHDDARRVERADINRWVEALIARGLAKKTVTGGYLPPIRLTFAIAHEDGAITTNPASGINVRAPKAVKLRERDLTDDEASTILRAALGAQPPKLDSKHALARRWVPWLCAYTGARVGEMTQLRAKDIRQEQGVWVLHVTPEAGSIKTNEARSIPLHSHLIEQGILELAREDDASPLFHRAGAGNAVNPASKIRAADLAKWVRTLGITALQPNHGWRHRFKTVARAASIPADIADSIQGHAPSNEGGKYGAMPIAALHDAMRRIPRYEIGLA